MKWSFKLGRILGIDVHIHVTFLLLLAFVGFSNWMASRSPASAVSAVAFFLALFGCVLLHEYGHALAARANGIQTRDIMLLPIGGVARLERMPDKPLQELWVAVAGPLVNVVIAAGLFLGLKLKGLDQFALDTMSGGLAQRLLAVNIFLVIFNLLPAFPMDGGRVLRALLAMKLPHASATRIAAAIGKAMAVLFGFVGLFSNPLLLLIALFVWIGASQESAMAEMKSLAPAATAEDAMITHFRSLAPEQTLAEAARHLLAGSQQDFPVIDQGRLVGLLIRKDLFRALQDRGEAAPVSAVMLREYPVVQAGDALDNALGEMRPAQGITSVPVLRYGSFVGLLTAENVGEFFMLRAALSRSRDAAQARAVPPVISAPWYPVPPAAASRGSGES